MCLVVLFLVFIMEVGCLFKKVVVFTLCFYASLVGLLCSCFISVAGYNGIWGLSFHFWNSVVLVFFWVFMVGYFAIRLEAVEK